MKQTVAILLAAFCSLPAFAASLRVAAAASLIDVLHEIGPRYEKQSGDTLLYNFGASSLLARQIQEGAPADLFISADELKMDELQQRGLVVKKSRRSILSNTLVIIVPSDSNVKITSPKDLADAAIRNVAVAEPQTVPAGMYAKEYLRKLHVWDKIKYKLIPTENVRAALAAVEAGSAETAIVYKTDALISKVVRIAYEVPASEGPEISYPAAVLADSKQQAAAQRLLDYLQSPAAQEIFRKYGFLIKTTVK
jgi:molybdate transport system substrate-binding protein